MDSLKKKLEKVLTSKLGFNPILTKSEFSDIQANGILKLATQQKQSPRKLAEEIVAKLDLDKVKIEISGPGFLNITYNNQDVLDNLLERAQADKLGIPALENKKTLIDYSSVNVAKQMHVGHLRSTLIGDTLVRFYEFLGTEVIRQNHLGDWGTQFGMLIQFILEKHLPLYDLADVENYYRQSKQLFDSDKDFADRAKARVVLLQGNEPSTIGVWKNLVNLTLSHIKEIYNKLEVTLTNSDIKGESFYNPFLSQTVDDLISMGIGVKNDGAICVFHPDISDSPLIIQKSDGGYTYGCTDLAALRYRVEELKASRILYVVDSRQELHFKLVFATAKKAGWIHSDVELVHVSHGSVLDTGGVPFKTRSGDVKDLDSLISSASIAVRLFNDKIPVKLADIIGIGAVKYAELSTSRNKDYIFDPEKFTSLDGNTGPYLQYMHARVNSILEKCSPYEWKISPVDLVDQEKKLALLLDEFSDTLVEAALSFSPHLFANYLYRVANSFSSFYEACPVLKAPEDIKSNRILLCDLTLKVLKTGLILLGIEAPETI